MNTPPGQQFPQEHVPAAKRGACLALEPGEEAALAVPVLEPGQQLADPAGQLWGPAQVDPPLAPALAPGHLKVGAESASAVRAPRGGQRAPGGKKCKVGNEIRPRPLKLLHRFLVNKFAFFHVGGVPSQDSSGRGNGGKIGNGATGFSAGLG